MFKIANLERESADGFVTTVHWTASKTDGTYTAGSYGTISYTQKPEEFVPYDQLTEAQVIGWVETSMGEEGLAALNLRLDNDLAAQANPPIKSGLPWSN